ncbi:MAG: helix-turn-helix domain-containing protein [Alphaproteobacteria bacterium]|nr:helix-turn-helix domain-containing protein [Alphaproteobacteria bacterium]
MNSQIARTPTQIGEAIRRRRKALHLTQTDLGNKAKLRQATISDLETGEPGTELRTLLDVLATLELELLIRPRTKASASDIEAAF